MPTDIGGGDDDRHRSKNYGRANFTLLLVFGIACVVISGGMSGFHIHMVCVLHRYESREQQWRGRYERERNLNRANSSREGDRWEREGDRDRSKGRDGPSHGHGHGREGGPSRRDKDNMSKRERERADADREASIGSRPTLLFSFFAFYGVAVAGHAVLLVLYWYLYFAFDMRCSLD